MSRPSDRRSDLALRPSSDLVLDRLDRVVEALDIARPRLDELNVFPVADGDTGSNLAITLGQARSVVHRSVSSLDDVLDGLPVAAMRSARGNSGLLLAAWLAGACRSLPRGDGWPSEPAPAIAAAFAAAAIASRDSVDDPVEGTFLSVADAAAAAARAHTALDPSGLVEAAADGAAEAVLRTPDQLPVLREHGVVDAGGLGLVVVLRALDGADLDVHGWIDAAVGGPIQVPRTDTDPDDALVEVMLDLETTDGDLLTERWRELGDSIVVAGGPRRWHGHVHTTRPSAAVQIASALGAVSNVRATSVHGQRPVPVPGPGEEPSP